MPRPCQASLTHSASTNSHCQAAHRSAPLPAGRSGHGVVTTGVAIAASPCAIRRRAARPRRWRPLDDVPPPPVAPDLAGGSSRFPWARSRPMTARDVPVEPRMRLGDASPGRLVVALTLDACPGAFDERIATALVESGIKATIFVTGLWLRENPVGLAFLLAHRDLFVHREPRRAAYPAGPRPSAHLRHCRRRRSCHRAARGH